MNADEVKEENVRLKLALDFEKAAYESCAKDLALAVERISAVRAAALEEAAKVCERVEDEHSRRSPNWLVREDCAKAIRSLAAASPPGETK